MSNVFTKAMENIGTGLADASSLDVTLYQGTVKQESLKDGVKLDKFDTLLKKASAETNFKLLASSQFKLDGDVTMFVDESISLEGDNAALKLHMDLVKQGQETRQASVAFLKSIVDSAVDL